MFFQSPYSFSSPYVSHYHPYHGFAPSRYGYDPSDYYPHQHHQIRHYPSYQPAPVSHPRLVLRAVPAYESARAAHSARLIDDLEDLIRLGVLAQAEAQQHQQLINENQQPQQPQQQLESESGSKSESGPSSSVVESKSDLPVGSQRVPIHRAGQVSTQPSQVEPKQVAPRREQRVSKSRRGRGGLFDVFSDLFSLSQLEPQDTFNTKMKEEDKQYVIEAELPSGVTKDEVELNVENHLLTLTATVKAKPQTQTQQTDNNTQEKPQEENKEQQSESSERKKSVVVEDEKETENDSVRPTEDKPKSESQKHVETTEKHKVDSEATQQQQEAVVERSYTRIIQLPENASEDGIQAKFEDQILRIQVPKIQPKKTHKINIQ